MARKKKGKAAQLTARTVRVPSYKRLSPGSRVFLSYSYHADRDEVKTVRNRLGKVYKIVEAEDLPQMGSVRDAQLRIAEAISKADAVVAVLSTETAATATIGEMAFAHAKGKPVYVVSKKRRDLVPYLADHYYRSADELPGDLPGERPPKQ
jgi:nucleoside 2-deoxyribosyltransferase